MLQGSICPVSICFFILLCVCLSGNYNGVEVAGQTLYTFYKPTDVGPKYVRQNNHTNNIYLADNRYL